MNWRSKLLKATGPLFFLLSMVVLFVSFRSNRFHAADQIWFQTHQDDSESLVIGRLAQSRREGIFNEAGRLGRIHENDPKLNLGYNQWTLYFSGSRNGVFVPYTSQIGVQGIALSALDSFLDKQGWIARPERIELYRDLTTLMTACALSLLLVGFFIEFGVVAASIALITTAVSQRLVIMGDNLYWIIWAMFLPMVAVWVLHQREDLGKGLNYWLTATTVALLTALKCGAGFEFISTVMVAATTPLIYFSIKNRWSKSLLLRRVLLVGLPALFAFSLVIAAHIWQESMGNDVSLTESFKARLTHAYSRTHVEEAFFRGGSWSIGARATLPEVLSGYYNSQTFNLKTLLGFKYFHQVNFGDLILIFLIFSALAFLSERYSKDIDDNRRTLLALVATTWFSLLAPLSWFILAKVHSALHLHVNPLLWHLPFTIFGFVLVGTVSNHLVKTATRRVLSRWQCPSPKWLPHFSTNNKKEKDSL